MLRKNERLGIGHAIEITEDIVQNDELMIVLGDTIAEFDITEVLAAPHSMLGVKKVDDPQYFWCCRNR